MLWKLFKNTVRSKDCIWLCEEFSDATLGPELADRVLDFFIRLMPLYDYFNKFKV